MKPKDTELWREESIGERKVYLDLLPCTTRVSCSALHRVILCPTAGVTLTLRRLFPSLHCRDEDWCSHISCSLLSIAGIFQIAVYVFFGNSCKDSYISHFPFFNNYQLFFFWEKIKEVWSISCFQRKAFSLMTYLFTKQITIDWK